MMFSSRSREGNSGTTYPYVRLAWYMAYHRMLVLSGTTYNVVGHLGDQLLTDD